MGLSDDVEDVDTNPDVETRENEDMGTGVARVASGARVWSSLYLYGPDEYDEDTEIDVAGYWKDDEPPKVEVSVYRNDGNLNLDMKPERARTLAAELMLAANRADEGDKELGDESWD